MNGVMDSREVQKPSLDAIIEDITAFWICSFVFDTIPRVMEMAAVAARWAGPKQEAMRKVFESRVGE